MFPKKKPALDVTIAAFKPKPKGGDLDTPDPVDMASPKRPMKPDAEPDGDEGGDDYGAKLIADIEAAGQSLGMDAAQSRQAAGSFFKAAADCLMRGAGGDEDSGDEGSGAVDETAY